MSKENLTDFTLSKKSYASFDALTLKQLLKDRLNEEGVFTDQIFEGSNILYFFILTNHLMKLYLLKLLYMKI